MLNPVSGLASVVINEIKADVTERLVDFSKDPVRVGSGTAWFEQDYDDSFWSAGAGPWGWQTQGLVSDAQVPEDADVQALYLRNAFVADAATAASASKLVLEIDYSDGFIVLVNGVELTRRNMGIKGLIAYRDQSAFRTRTRGSYETVELGTASELLVEGNNVIALQVHDSYDNDNSVYVRARLRVGSTYLLTASDSWRWFPGWVEPSGGVFDYGFVAPGVDPAVRELVEFEDWIELHNTTSQTVDLTGWSLTDDPDEPAKWQFPETSIEGGGYLIVLASGMDIVPAEAARLHANFNLSSAGEFLGLYNARGIEVDSISPRFPPQNAFHSFQQTADGQPRFFDLPTPGQPNAPTWSDARLPKPTISPTGGFHSGPLTVTMDATSGLIRYTTDGTEPDAVNGMDYVGPLTVTASTAFRVRTVPADGTGSVPSDVVTRTFLVDEPEALRGSKAVCLTADPGRSLFLPFGVTAISGGYYSGSGLPAWFPSGPFDYNIPRQSGRAFERPGYLEIYDDDAGTSFAAGTGMRISGSLYSRERFTFDDLDGLWDGGFRDKPMLNLFFRGDYGNDRFEGQIFDDAVVTSYDSLRLRSGKNDAFNPFIRDELIRRLTADMGQPTAVGMINGLFVNGEFKGYYNLCERYREEWFQETYGSSLDWDVRQQFYEQVDGTGDFFWDMVDYLQDNDLRVLENYQGALEWLDPVNFADYLIIMSYTAMTDWPHNNHTLARERSPAGRYRFHVWDAEGGMGGMDSSLTRNTFYSELGGFASPGDDTLIIRLAWKALRASPEFRMVFADRVQKHFFDGGALTPANLTTRFSELKSEFEPLLLHVRREALDTAWFYEWRNQRQTIYFSQLSQFELWPGIEAPQFSYEGPVEPGLQVDIYPLSSGDVYYTTDGTDPRAPGGAVHGSLYSTPIPIEETTVLTARVLDGSTWSPVRSYTYTAPPDPDFRVTEIMYHPADSAMWGDTELEFIEVWNSGDDPLDLTGLRFVEGIIFDFPAEALEPGGHMVIVSNPTAFASVYPDVVVAGEFIGQLSNSGERLVVQDEVGQVVWELTYADIAPWPTQADGMGYSLVPDEAWEGGASEPEAWRASTQTRGSPGSVDPKLVLVTHADFFPNAIDGGGGWFNTWIGWESAVGFPWIYSLDHGWLFCGTRNAASAWFFDLELGWWWSSNSLFPHFYSPDNASWFYFLHTGEDTRWLYDFSSDTWTEYPRSLW